MHFELCSDLHPVQIYKITTVEDFWAVFNNIAEVTEVPVGSTYHFFKTGIEPMWEDPGNKAGGKWVLAGNGKDARSLWELAVRSLSFIRGVLLC